MAISIRKLARQGRELAPGHRACAGCAFPSIIRIVLSVTDDPIVVVNATGCMEVVTSIYPYNSWPVTWFHSAFDNAGATVSGIDAAYKALVRKGKIPADKKIRFVVFAGDGGTYDIGLQALSGAIERFHDFLYVCYDNGAYMNTGIQRSGATPRHGSTTTSPAGTVVPGKQQRRKPLTEIVAAHDLPYAAQGSPGHWLDLARKAEKGLLTDGPAFLNVLSACPPGWGYPDEKTVEISQLAVETGFWPLYEVENGFFRITVRPKEFKPLEDFLKAQTRFRHILKDPKLLEDLKADVKREWERLEFLASRPRPEGEAKPEELAKEE